jgi:hypothetical protein
MASWLSTRACLLDYGFLPSELPLPPAHGFLASELILVSLAMASWLLDSSPASPVAISRLPGFLIDHGFQAARRLCADR